MLWPKEQLRVRVQASWFDGLTRLWLIKDEMDGLKPAKRYVGRIVWEPMGFEGDLLEPTATLVEDTEVMEEDGRISIFQKLVDALEKEGFVAEKVKESDSEVKAIKYHLEDMRRLVFHE